MGYERAARAQAPEEQGGSRLTLEPIRNLGPDALDTEGLPAITKIILRLDINEVNAMVRQLLELLQVVAAVDNSRIQ